MLHTSAESERRTLTGVGVAVVLSCAVAIGIYSVSSTGGRPDDRISVRIDAAYAVQGVASGTPVVMHGVEVGKVTAISSLPDGRVQLDTDLQKKPVAGLTDKMQIDFRPANYFGVTGVNVIPSAAGGQPLRDGTRVDTVPQGNFTLQALLTHLGRLSTGVITEQLINVIDRATRYTDALDPLIETMMITSSAVAKVQTVPTAQLLSNATGLSVVLPSFLNQVTNSADDLAHGDNNWMHKGLGDLTEDEVHNFMLPTINATANGIFGSIGRLEASHAGELLPLVNGMTPLVDAIPPLLRPVGVGDMLVELRQRFEKLYAGTPEQRALQVRIVLDSLPGVAAPLGVMGVP
ncbi:MlaD family protein [Mycobacterium colombiense]|uniref:MlaD family protein n=1 Tax=Mycobacterium colombiense TaxID=339268 RepID=UPI003AF8421B